MCVGWKSDQGLFWAPASMSCVPGCTQSWLAAAAGSQPVGASAPSINPALKQRSSLPTHLHETALGLGQQRRLLADAAPVVLLALEVAHRPHAWRGRAGCEGECVTAAYGQHSKDRVGCNADRPCRFVSLPIWCSCACLCRCRWHCRWPHPAASCPTCAGQRGANSNVNMHAWPQNKGCAHSCCPVRRPAARLPAALQGQLMSARQRSLSPTGPPRAVDERQVTAPQPRKSNPSGVPTQRRSPTLVEVGQPVLQRLLAQLKRDGNEPAAGARDEERT